MPDLSKHDIHKLFMRKAAEEVSDAELMAAHSYLSEVVKLAFGYRRGGNLSKVLTVKTDTLFDQNTGEKVLHHLKVAMEEVERQITRSYNGGDGED